MNSEEQRYKRLYDSYLQFHREVSKELHERLGERLTAQVQIEILSRIDAGLVYSKDLAIAMGYTPSAIAQQINVLEKEGLIMRKRSLHDKRIIRLQLTESGQALLLECRKQLSRSLTKVTSALSEKEILEFCALFEKMTASKKG